MTIGRPIFLLGNWHDSEKVVYGSAGMAAPNSIAEPGIEI